MSKVKYAQLIEICNALLEKKMSPDEACASHPIFEIATVANATQTAKQVIALSKFLELTFWSGLMACCLVNGVVPPDSSLDDDKQLYSFDLTDDGEQVALGHSSARIHDVRHDHREWRHSEDAKGFVSPLDFFDWCELEGIDTNYLRLLREIAGCSTSRPIGTLPLRNIQRFNFDSLS